MVQLIQLDQFQVHTAIQVLQVLQVQVQVLVHLVQVLQALLVLQVADPLGVDTNGL